MIKRPAQSSAFTLVEVLVASTVLLAILALMLVLCSSVARLTTSASGRISSFQESRTAFEMMTRTLTQALLQTYWDYDNPGVPNRYIRASELHFAAGDASSLTGLQDAAGGAVFFQAPLGYSTTAALKSVPDLLNSVGFYVRFGTSTDLPSYIAGIEPATAAYRLWMYLQPTEKLQVYSAYSGAPQKGSVLSWFQGDIAQPEYNHILANHVVLLLIRCRYADASGVWKESYSYNSRPALVSNQPQAAEMHQIPPILNLTLVVIDEPTAIKLHAYKNGRYDLLEGKTDLFTQADKYKDDLADFEKHLRDKPIGGIPVNYRIFESTVNISSSKWSL